MDTTIIVQIIASSVSLIGIFFGLIFAWAENKRGKYIEIITNQTLKNMLFMRENAATFSMLTRPEIIHSDMEGGNYKFQLMQAAANIESIMKYKFNKEREIINLVRKLTKLCINYYDNSSNEMEQLIKTLNEKFYMLITVYDYSDWQYIKAQAKTKPYKDFPDYDAIYEEQKALFDKSEKPTKW